MHISYVSSWSGFASTFNVLIGSVPWQLNWSDFQGEYEEGGEEEEFVDDYAA